jgi:3-deoxy-D-manno-octulosonate 8-phosphate phosphatase (KDO 8-P phosphatase)
MSAVWGLPPAAAQRREAQRRLGRELTDRLAAIRLLVLDCDGILTDGSLHYGPDGEAVKVFDARDGLGLLMLGAAGVARAVLTGRTSPMVRRRCEDLRFEAIKMARFDKLEALAEIWTETGCTAAVTLYMGDDLLDLPAIVAAGVGATVPAAPAAVRDACQVVTVAPGGRGAVREICDLLLMARGAQGTALSRLIAAGHPANLEPGKAP